MGKMICCDRDINGYIIHTYEVESLSFEELYERSLEAIKKKDSEKCGECGGEDCVCCENYNDRKDWSPYDEFFE